MSPKSDDFWIQFFHFENLQIAAIIFLIGYDGISIEWSKAIGHVIPSWPEKRTLEFVGAEGLKDLSAEREKAYWILVTAGSLKPVHI